MKIKDDANIMRYVREYLNYGIQEQLFNEIQATGMYNKLINLGVEYYPASFPGDAKFENGIIKINTARTFSTDRNASLILFHEFTHACSGLHSDMYSNNSLLKKVNIIIVFILQVIMYLH